MSVEWRRSFQVNKRRKFMPPSCISPSNFEPPPHPFTLPSTGRIWRRVSFRLCACHVGWQNFYELRAAEAGAVSRTANSKTVGTSPLRPSGRVAWRASEQLGVAGVLPSGSCKFRSSICCRCPCLISSCQGFLAKFNKNFMSLKRMFMEIFHLNLRKVINVNRIPEKVRQQNSKPEDRRGRIKSTEGAKAPEEQQAARKVAAAIVNSVVNKYAARSRNRKQGYATRISHQQALHTYGPPPLTGYTAKKVCVEKSVRRKDFLKKIYANSWCATGFKKGFHSIQHDFPNKKI